MSFSFNPVGFLILTNIYVCALCENDTVNLNKRDYTILIKREREYILFYFINISGLNFI